MSLYSSFVSFSGLNLCLTNDIRDIENRATFLQNKIRCYDLWSSVSSFRYPPVSRYIVLHLDIDQPTAMTFIYYVSTIY